MKVLKYNKRFGAIIFIIMLILSLSFSLVTQAQGENKSDKNRIIKVAGDMNYPPYEYVDEDRKFTGYNVEIIKKIAEKKGFKVQIIPMSWERAVKSLEKGEVDLVQGMTNSGNRSEKFLFSTPIVENDYVIFTLSGNSNIESIMDLNNKKVSYQISDLAEEVLISKEINRVGVKDQSDAIRLLLDKKVDAFVGNKLTGMYHLQKINAIDKVQIKGSPLLRNEYSIVSNKENKELMSIINNGINILKTSGEYDEIYNKWFGSLFEANSNTLRIILSILLVIFIIVIIIIFVVAFYNEKLKKGFDKLDSEKDSIKQELEMCQEDELMSRTIMNMLLKDVDTGMVIFDTNGVVKKFNDTVVTVIKEDLRVGDTFKSLNLQETLGIELGNSVPTNNIDKEVKIVVNQKIFNYRIRILDVYGSDNKPIGWMMLTKKQY